MTSIKKLTQFIGLGLATMGLVACGGGGSTDGGDSLTPQSGTGLMSLAVTDAPIDDAKRVVIRFTHVELQPADGGERVVIYFNDPDPVEESVDTGPVDAQIEALVEESVEEPVQEPKQGVVREIDLLALQGEDSEFLFQGVQVPAKDYDWIRFYLEPEPGASAPPLSNFATSSFIEFENDYRENLIIPGGLQAGLQLVSGFTVPEDDSVAFTVDFDLRNAIQKDEQFEGYHRMRRALRLVDNSNVGVITGTVDPTLFPSGYTCNENAKICPGLSVVVYAVDSDQNGGDPEEAESEKMQAAAVLEDPLTTANVRYRQVNGSWEYRYTVGFLNAGIYDLKLTFDEETVLDGVLGVPVVAGEKTEVNFSNID
jgi:hypothetical protein